MKNRSISYCVALFLVTFWGILVQQKASADSIWPFYQISCVPDLQHFSIRSFRLGDSPFSYILRDGDVSSFQDKNFNKAQIRAFKKLERMGIFTAHGLERKRFECHIPAYPYAGANKSPDDVPLDVVVEGKYQGYLAASPCGGSVKESVRVVVNGKDIGTLAAEGECPRTPDTDTTIDIVAFGKFLTVERCDHASGDIWGHGEETSEATCRRWDPREER